MYGSLFWIEWLDRLDRVLNSARQDLVILSRAIGPRGRASLERSQRQLSALSNDLRLLDRSVFVTEGETPSVDGVEQLQKALDTALMRLEGFTDVQAATAPAVRDRVLGGIDAALRDSRYEAARLLEPKRRRA
jgi:hypothetical protein